MRYLVQYNNDDNEQWPSFVMEAEGIEEALSWTKSNIRDGSVSVSAYIENWGAITQEDPPTVRKWPYKELGGYPPI